MEKFDIRDMTKGVDEALAATTDPHHRAILKNYRRHGLLEVSGLWQEILSPAMTVAEPSYRIMYHNRTEVYEGMDAVRGLYSGLAEMDPMLFGPIDEKIAVADWGFAAESKFDVYLPGSELANIGYDVEDSDTLHRARVPVAFIWHYTRDALLIGENVYQDWGAAQIEVADPADLITIGEARERLAPLLENEPA
ncbi:hypothetical protein [Citricoccus sp. GCM10030269]|uniref:hypothetical protein n=1 Tax=Citricoccus sp. GCM10030269 TaxID=3273388 RepID=UPI00360957BE